MKTGKTNFNIASTIINDRVRVSTAGIWLGFQYGDYLQYETWVFSDDPNQRSIQVIHGTHFAEHEGLKAEGEKVHGYLVANMNAKFEQLNRNI